MGREGVEEGNARECTTGAVARHPARKPTPVTIVQRAERVSSAWAAVNASTEARSPPNERADRKMPDASAGRQYPRKAKALELDCASAP